MEYDVIIIGAGISGITCGIYLKRAGINTLIIENNMPGGQLNKASVIENYPGHVGITGVELASTLLEQISSNNIDMLNDDINSIDYDKKEIVVGNNIYKYKYLVFASGRRERRLEITNEEEFIGRGISFCATCDGALYRDKDVIVVGGGSSAISEALYLANICKRVYLIYRGDELKGEEILKDRLNVRGNIEVIYNSNVNEYLINNNKLTGVMLDNGDKVEASCVFLAVGQLPNSELFDGEKDNNYIVVDSNGKTSREYVYACGDVIKKDIYQLVTASNDGLVVASSIISNLR